jgi:hypothetical protein
MTRKPAGASNEQLTKFRFIGTVSSMGKEKRIIWIPKKYHKEVDQLFEGKQVRIIIDDEF